VNNGTTTPKGGNNLNDNIINQFKNIQNVGAGNLNQMSFKRQQSNNVSGIATPKTPVSNVTPRKNSNLNY
jgi:hypothetical protein